MRKIFKIFKRDYKRIMTNTSALCIVIGLCFIPSLYAWINIKACWDPYANTGNLPIAVINKDEGANINNKSINIGEEVEKSLKENKSIKWIFVDEWQANYGLNEGEYYALIEIPQDFTKGMISLTTTMPKKPTIIYRVNEKANAIATKITSAAKEKVAGEIKTNFVNTVNEETFEALNSIGSKLNNNKTKIIELRDIMISANKSLGDIKNHVENSNNNAKSLENYLYQVQNNLPLITNQINSLQKVTSTSKDLINTTQDTVDELSRNLSNDIIQMQSINQNVQSLLLKLKQINNSGNTEQREQIIIEIENLIDSLSGLIESDIKALEALNNISNNVAVEQLINSLKNVEALLQDSKVQLELLRQSIASGAAKDKINLIIDGISSANNTISKELANLSSKFFASGLNALNSVGDSFKRGLNVADSILEGTRVVAPSLNALTNYGIASSELASKQAEKLTDKLSDFEEKVTMLTEKTSGLNEESINEVIKIMEKNPQVMASFISSPIEIEKEEVYDTGIFGVGLTPFYTVLAIWVGALLISSLLTVECDPFDDGEKLSMAQEHFGKMIIFLVISFIQTLIVTLGDKYVLGVNPENIMLMMGFAFLTSITFTIIIFTLVSIFGNVGKAIAVVIMVFQIAGSGGIYPIQTNPDIFGRLQPLWPFTYAIDGFRQAIAGPVWNDVYKDIKALCLISVVFVLLVALKKPFHKLTHGMEHKFKESGL